MLTIDVCDFAMDEDLARDRSVFIIVKGFNQLAIVDKIIRRHGNKALGLTSSDDVTKRRYSNGCIAYTNLESNSFDRRSLEARFDCLEPYDIHINGGLIALTNGFAFRLLRPSVGLVREYESDWMAYLHTVELSPDNRRVLTASAGLDTILEIDLASGKTVWEWNAWDHGFNFVKLTGQYITRNADQARGFRERYGNEKTIFIEDPSELPREGLPTHHTPVNLNGVHYGPDDKILATGYHRPEVFVIDRSGELTKTELGLKNPHSFMELTGEAAPTFMVASTGAGCFFLLNQDFAPTVKVCFDGLPANEEKKLGFGEWLQTVSPLHDSHRMFAAVDALRNGVHIVDLDRQRRRFIKSPPEWTIQAVVPAPSDSGPLVEVMSNLRDAS